jgi:hypothetical protein
MNKYFAPEETLVANELWNFLSGQQNTMEEILDIINTISTTSFLDKFRLLADNTRRQTPEYISQLQEWNLFSEIELIENDSIITQQIANNAMLTRMYNKRPFDFKGNYTWERYYKLRSVF